MRTHARTLAPACLAVLLVAPTAVSCGGDEDEKIDACALLAQADAEAIFGGAATPDQGAPVTDPNYLGECLWSHDTMTTGSLLALYVWKGAQYYNPPPPAQPFAIGEMGAVAADDSAGVDIEWVQDGRTYVLSYFTTGPGAPAETAAAEQVKALALQISMAAP